MARRCSGLSARFGWWHLSAVSNPLRFGEIVENCTLLEGLGPRQSIRAPMDDTADEKFDLPQEISPAPAFA
jgi:hypothetical protein